MIAGKFGSIGWHFAALILTFIVMVAGISAGIEKINKFMMPAFFGMFLILAIRVLFLPGSSAGYSYLFSPKWELLGDPKTWVFALGQAFFLFIIGRLWYISIWKLFKEKRRCSKLCRNGIYI